jgi:streptogramin lyase
LKQSTLILALLGTIVLAGCGSSNTTSQTTFNNGSGNQPFKPTTHLSHRSLVTNSFAGQLQVVDTVQNRLTTSSFAVGSQPTYMQPSPDGTLTFVNNTGSNTISSLNNNLEAVKATINLGGSTDSFVTSKNNTFGFAAVKNYSNGTFRLPGAIVRFNPTDGSLNTAIGPFPNVRYIAMDTAESHLLAFTDLDAYSVDLTSFDVTTQLPAVSLALSLKDASGNSILSRPVAAFFSSDSTKAYILSCGVECGGSLAPSVIEIDVTTIDVTSSAPTATVVNQWFVPGARRGLIDLNANLLYVAGSATATGVQNNFTTIDLAAQTASAPIPIGNGSARWIRNINGIFWVASINCGAQSCITIVNPATSSASILPTPKGDATGVYLSQNSGQVYTIEGGGLNIYDQHGNPVTSTYTTDVKGQASDVLYID